MVAMNAHEHPSSACAPAIAPLNIGTVLRGAETVERSTEIVSLAFISLAQVLGRQAAAEFMRLGVPAEAMTTKEFQNA